MRSPFLRRSSRPDSCPAASVPGGAGSEDCLNVNVYAPLNASAGDMRKISFGALSFLSG